MNGGVLELFSTEIKQSFRAFRRRTTERPLMTGWFILLLVVGFWTILMMVELAKGLDEPLITLSEGDVLFTIFFVIMSKASVETVENTLRNKRLKHYFSTSVSIRKVQISRFLKVFWYNLLLVAISISIVVLLVKLFGFAPPIGEEFFYKLYVLFLISPIIGFNLGTISQIKGVFKKFIPVAIYGQNITLVWLILHADVSPVKIYYYLLILGSISFIFFLSCKNLFWRAWKYGTTTSTDESFRFHEAGDFLPEFISSSVRRVAEKEMLTRWRRRESPAGIAVTGAIASGLIFFYIQLGPSPDLGLELGAYLYPILISISIFLAVILQVVFPSLSLLGREGQAFWVMKSVPIEAEDIVWGKALAMLIYTPIIPLVIALPLPLILSYSVYRVLFLVFSSILTIFLLTGIGVWAGVKFPNFDESSNGAPDVTTMYTMMVSGLIVSIIFIGVPAFVFRIDAFLGLLFIIFMTDVSAAVFLGLVKRAAVNYHRTEMNF